MRVELAYGDGRLPIDVPESAVVLTPRHVEGFADEAEAIRAALKDPIGSPPLAALLEPGQRVVIVHSDITRPMPNDRVLPVLLSEIESAGVRRADITLLNALGTHRRQTDEELRTMLGERIVREYRCMQHDAWDDGNLVPIGTTSFGHPVRINRTYLEADAKILTGFIEPHFFAGFSGGPKAVLPSVAGAESVLANHGATMIGHPGATWGRTEPSIRRNGDGNPVWQEMLEVALATNPTFLLNVTLNPKREITGVFAGDLELAHQAGRRFCAESAMVTVPAHFDIVITSNSGYPLDQNLYQSVKGMSAAARVVKEGGAILIAAECRDGLPDHGRYAELLRAASSPGELLSRVTDPAFASHDQWQVQIQAMIQSRAEVHVFAGGLSEKQITEAMLIPCADIQQCLEQLLEKYGAQASVCVIPEGPQTVPTVARPASPTR